MFCGECGAKLKKGAAFCEECGAKVPQENEKKGEKVEPVEKEKTPKKPMSKKNKIILGVAIIVAIVVFAGYQLITHQYSPETIASSFMDAIVKKDAGKVYGYLDITDDGVFMTKEKFVTVFDKDMASVDIKNYKLDRIDYSSGGLSARAVFKVTSQSSSSEDTVEVNLVKSQEKKLLVFDHWTVSEDTLGYAIQNYTIQVPKGATVSLDGVTLEEKYLSKDMDTTSLDVYKIPRIYPLEVELKTVFKSGITITDKVTPTEYNDSYTVRLSLSNLGSDTVNTLKEQVKTDVSNLYQNIVAQKTWADVKESYTYPNSDLSDLEETYSELYRSIVSDDDDTLKAFGVTDVVIQSVSLDDDGKLLVGAKISYTYTIEYKNYRDEIQTNSSKSSFTTNITYDYEDNAYKLNDLSRVVSYFSTWY